jgi:hypothetical protein
MDNESKARSLGGGAVLGALFTGAAAIALAATGGISGHFEAAALALLAAAVAFVGVANAIFRQ